MEKDTLKDLPPHQLSNFEQSINKLFKLLISNLIDQVPQIFNILLGEMSIIPTRPILWNQYFLQTERDMYRVNLLRLGLSGCAQINGRDKLTIAEKAKLDGEYLKRQSYFVDIFILLKATLKIFKDESWLEDGIIKLGKVK